MDTDKFEREDFLAAMAEHLKKAGYAVTRPASLNPKHFKPAPPPPPPPAPVVSEPTWSARFEMTLSPKAHPLEAIAKAFDIPRADVGQFVTHNFVKVTFAPDLVRNAVKMVVQFRVAAFAGPRIYRDTTAVTDEFIRVTERIRQVWGLNSLSGKSAPLGGNAPTHTVFDDAMDAAGVKHHLATPTVRTTNSTAITPSQPPPDFYPFDLDRLLVDPTAPRSAAMKAAFEQARQQAWADAEAQRRAAAKVVLDHLVQEAADEQHKAVQDALFKDIVDEENP